MSIVTTRAGDVLAGCLVGYLTQCSMNPVHWLACLSHENFTFRTAEQADALAVHFLATDEFELAELFGSKTGDNFDKFAHCRWRSGPLGLPILKGCKRWVAGSILHRLDCGDHTGFLIDTQAAHCAEGPWHILRLVDCHSIKPGHPPPSQ